MMQVELKKVVEMQPAKMNHMPYAKNFSVAFANWEINRLEDRMQGKAKQTKK